VKNIRLAATILAVGFASFSGASSAVGQNYVEQSAAAHRPAPASPKKKIEGALPHSPLATDGCSFSFTSGADNTLMSYCVTVNGNVLDVTTPASLTNIFTSEGYGFCDINSNTEYFDYSDGGDSGNWNPAVVVSHSASQVKIVRTTSDGIWTLTQVITQVPASSSVKVSMTVKNNTAANRELQLVRFADIDADGIGDNTIDATINDAMIYSSVARAGNHTGLALQNVGTSPFTYLGYVQNVPFGVSPCSPFTNMGHGPLTETDGSAVMTYVVPVPARSSKTVTIGYRGL
jgi:hypothetical protein